jgi:hypothetical protein
MPYNVDQRGWFSWPNNVFTHLDSKRLTKPLGLHYQIEYKQGPNNRLANPLTLYPQSASSCSVLSAVSPVWLQSVVASYDSDPSIRLLAKLAVDAAAVSNFTLRIGILRYKDDIWVGAETFICRLVCCQRYMLVQLVAIREFQ